LNGNPIANLVLSGADSVMIFDTWGGVLSKQNYLDFSLDTMAKVVKVLLLPPSII
jgi:uroporphyrinogen decarboxylase